MTAKPWHDKYIGIPFVEGGRSFDGCDCGGLVLLALKQEKGIMACDVNLIHERRGFHSRDGQRKLAQAIAYCLKEWREIPTGSPPNPFDLALFMVPSGEECHCGCVVTTRKMLHVEQGRFAHIVEIKPRISGYIFMRYLRHERLC